MICLLSTGPSMIRPGKKFWKSQKRFLIFSFLPPDFYHFSSNLKGKTTEFLERWKSNKHSSCLFVFKIRNFSFFAYCLFAYRVTQIYTVLCIYSMSGKQNKQNFSRVFVVKIRIFRENCLFHQKLLILRASARYFAGRRPEKLTVLG